MKIKSRDGSVRIALGYGLDVRGSRVRIPLFKCTKLEWNLVPSNTPCEK
jgi:hypothetical protein